MFLIVKYSKEFLNYHHQITVNSFYADTQKETKKLEDTLLQDIQGNQQNIDALLNVLDNCLKGLVPILNVVFAELAQV